MEEIRPVRRTAAPGCHRRNRHVSRRFCHRARCAAYPTSRLRAIVATPSGSTVDQASPRRQRQHFRVRDPEQYYADSKRSHSPAPSAISVRLRWLRAAFRLPKSSAPRRSAAIAQQPSARDARDCGERRPNTLLLGRSPRIGFQPLPERSRASARRTSRSRSLGPRIYGTVPSRQRSLSCSARWAGTARLLPSVGRPANCRNVPCRAHRATLPTEAAFRRPPTPCGSSRGEIYRRKAHFQLAIDAHALKVAKRGQEGLRRRAQRRSCESCRRRCVSAVATRTRHEPSSSKRDFPSRMRPTWQVAIRRSFSSWLLRRPLAIAMSTKPAFVTVRQYFRFSYLRERNSVLRKGGSRTSRWRWRVSHVAGAEERRPGAVAMFGPGAVSQDWSTERRWPAREMADRQVRWGLTDRYLVDTGRSTAVGRCLVDRGRDAGVMRSQSAVPLNRSDSW